MTKAISTPLGSRRPECQSGIAATLDTVSAAAAQAGERLFADIAELFSGASQLPGDGS